MAHRPRGKTRHDRVDDAVLSDLAVAWRRGSADPTVRDFVRACRNA